MRSARVLFACLLILGAVAILAPAGALASCGSGADNQYTDPLAGCNSGTPVARPSSSNSSSNSNSSSSASTDSSSGTTPTASSTGTTAGTSTGTTPAGTSKNANGAQLPYTGFDPLPSLLVAAGLLGGGMVLRRATGASRD